MAVPARPVSGAPIETAWGDIVHDGYVAQEVQAGRGSITITAAAFADLTVVFPHAFAGVPVIVANLETNNVSYFVNGTLPAAGQFNLKAIHRDGVSTTITLAFSWIAYGPRA